ncbi:MAG: type II toxin-antitoxin system HicA family toxin [Acetobacteraceae bacterium]
MKANDLIRRLSRLATRRGWEIKVTEGGSHTKVVLERHRTVIPRHARDLKTGTLRAILRQLELTVTDLED